MADKDAAEACIRETLEEISAEGEYRPEQVGIEHGRDWPVLETDAVPNISLLKVKKKPLV